MDDAGAAPDRAADDEATALPRRSRQGHLEPQLREPGGSGDGTPFTAFADTDPATADDTAEAGTSAAAFQRGTGRGPAD